MHLGFKIFLLLFFNISFSQQNDTLRRLFINEEKYLINFPSNWTLTKTDSLQKGFKLVSPKSNSADDFAENISLIIFDISKENLSDKKVLNEGKKTIKKRGKIITIRKIMKDNLKGQEIVFHEKTKEGIPCTILQYQLIKEKNVFLITFCAKSTEYLFYMPTIQSIIDSLKIK